MGSTNNEAVIRSVAIIALVWGAAYLGWRAVDTWEGTEPALFLLLYACELFGWAMLVSFCFLAWRIPVSKRPPIDRSHSVEVLVCTYDEGLDVLEATLLGCAGITYPHATWVLDDGRRKSVRSLAERTGARYLNRADNRHAKAGNINHALEVVGAELLLVLDADSPRRIEVGKQVHLVADLPMVDGVTRPVRLQLTVATCPRPRDDARLADRWHRCARR